MCVAERRAKRWMVPSITNPLHVTETFIAAVYTPSSARSPDLHAAVATSDQLISELETASEYVFGVPMYNFSVPAGFKAYIDQIVLPGRPYTIDKAGCKKGLLHGKKATVITSSGWLYRNGSPSLLSIFSSLGFE
jgi:FMN-dependent NADH-azoreductase